MSTQQRGGGRGRGGRSDSRGGFSNRGGAPSGDDRGGSSRGGGSFRGDRGGSFRGDRGGSFRGDRGGGFRGDRGGGFRGDRGGGFRGDRGGGRGRGGTFEVAHRSGPPASDGPLVYLEGNVPQPDQKVKALEESRVKHTRGQLLDGFPGRPGHGTKGSPIILRTNYLELNTAFEKGKQEIPLFRYSVAPVGETLSKPRTRILVENIIRSSLFDNMQIATDYASIIVTTKKLDLGTSDRKKGKIELVDPNQPTPQGPETPQAQEARRRRTKDYELISTGVFSLADLVRSLQGMEAGSWFGNRADVIQLLNIVLSKNPNTTPHIYAMGQNKYFPHGHVTLMESANLGGGLEALRGYYSSVRTATNRILVNLNVASAAFYKPLPVMELIGDYLGDSRRPPSAPQGADVLRKVEGFIRMLRVSTNYLKALDVNGKPKKSANGQVITVSNVKTIFSFASKPRFGNARNVSFSWTDPNNPQAAARNITVFDYFRTQHGITLRHADWPVLNVGSNSNPTYLPVELATVLHGQPSRRLLSGQQTTVMINFAARMPRLNAESIAGTLTNPGNGLSIMGLTSQAQPNTVNPFGFDVGTEMITVPGRILPTPEIYYGQKRSQPRDGSWNLREVKFTKPGTFARWACVVLDYEGQQTLLPAGAQMQGMPVLGDTALVQQLEKQLLIYGLKMGANMGTKHHTIPRPTEARRDQVDKVISEFMLKAEAARIDIILVVLREADKWLYSRIKYYGDVKHGIQTINAVGSKLQRPRGQDMYMGNLALKFNIKGGGISHTQKDMHPMDGNTILVGIDVTHPSPGSAEGSPSIAGVVANVDDHLCQWPGSLRCQTGRQEMVQGLSDMMVERLNLWRTRNQGRLPNKMIIYRDGVSEGQYNLVLQTELPAIQEAFKKLYGDAKKWPKVTIIVVGKRHHTRFYPTAQANADPKNGNPLPGTVVDRGITDHYLWDFWLQAHKGLQGTARPAHYVVIKDELKFTQDQLEQFTHKMCYLFNRATKAVSICPPAYYADLICERGRMYLYSTLNEGGSTGSAYNAQTAEWTEGVHDRLRDKTFYI